MSTDTRGVQAASAGTPLRTPVAIAAPERAAWWEALALPVLLAWQLMVVLDTTIVNIALTDIRDGLHFSPTGLSWVVNAYMLTFGGLLLLGGRAGDILGRRRVLVIGVTVFTAASLLGGFAPSAPVLLAARAAQGVGAAIAAPSTLSLIVTNFEDGPARHRALSLVSAISGVAASIGLVLGGVVTSALSWHWVFFINVPIGVVIVLLAPRALRESPRNPGRFDVGGAGASTLGVAALVYGLIHAADAGWGDRWTLASFAASAILLALLLLVERRASQPIMPLRLFANRNRAIALVNMLLIPSILSGIFFFLTQSFQVVRGYSALRTGIAFLPISLAVLLAARLAPRIFERFGARAMLAAATATMAAGLLWLTQTSAGGSYWVQGFLPFTLIGLGVGMTFMPLTTVIMSELRQEESGAAAGMLQTAQRTGGAIGLAVLVTVSGTVDRNALAAGKPAAEAMTAGIHGGFVAAFAIAALACGISVAGFRRR